jgi:hypothetical protein
MHAWKRNVPFCSYCKPILSVVSLDFKAFRFVFFSLEIVGAIFPLSKYDCSKVRQQKSQMKI